ncbi:DUF6361 family protein [Pseudolabrys sp. Root1462]|uniref:DUF6361 family protein n=1 Tax=Pseudolabrys sp. Root1462 TaxID=1736466 RepID=UPI000A802139|nr:DUF6361 family protein [Pseudolabrys sp. Root1462]
MSSFGWTYLSRSALRRAERQLSGAGEGVRDEIGFLIVHQRYADYFFPGTSVLHTRLRYALFVPWIYQSLSEEAVTGRVAERLERQEVRLAGRLKQAKERGVIGGLNHPRPTTQPPSVSYWAALGTWGILRQQDGRMPSRALLHAILQRKQRSAFDDDGQELQRAELPFAALPPRPDDWIGYGPLNFDLAPREAEFLHRQFVDLRPAVRPTHLSVLARLASGRKVNADTCYAPGIAELARDDAAKLRRAGHAAALAAVGRGVYAALVETLREEEDGQPTSNIHRTHLPKVLEQYGIDAGRLSLPELIEDVGTLPPAVTEALDSTLQWLNEGARNVMALRDVYERAECARKTQRARLSRVTGASRRLDWNNEEHTAAEPLHYRWNVVRSLLGDLWAAA